jgi:hypothetical protein
LDYICENKKQKKMIKIYRKELIYDVQQQCWKTALELIEDPQKRNEAQLHDDQNDIDIILRWCESGVAMLHVKFKDKLINPNTGKGFWNGYRDYDANQDQQSPYDTTEHDDKLKRDIESFDFHIGTSADEKALAVLFHKFIVRYCMWQWSRLNALTAFEQIAFRDLQKAEDDITDSLFDIQLPRKPHIHFMNDYTDNVTFVEPETTTQP